MFSWKMRWKALGDHQLDAGALVGDDRHLAARAGAVGVAADDDLEAALLDAVLAHDLLEVLEEVRAEDVAGVAERAGGAADHASVLTAKCSDGRPRRHSRGPRRRAAWRSRAGSSVSQRIRPRSFIDRGLITRRDDRERRVRVVFVTRVPCPRAFAMVRAA
jgi:hypothetical protein